MEKEDCFNQIYNTYLENKMAQSFLIQTNNNVRCLHDLIDLIMKIMPYSNVNFDNIVQNYVPNIIYVEPDGINVKKGQVLDIQTRFQTCPIYGEYNIYIINYAEKMNDASNNTMLKFIEEPEKNIIGFFICSSINDVMSTVKSRCQIFHKIYDREYDIQDFFGGLDNYNEKLENALSYISEIENPKSNILLYTKDKYDKISKDDIVILLKLMLKIYNSFLQFLTIKKICDKRYNDILSNNNKYQVTKKIELLVSKLDLLEYNMNQSLLLDDLVLEMRDINE